MLLDCEIYFPMQWYLSILNLFNILMMLNKCIVQWFWVDDTTKAPFLSYQSYLWLLQIYVLRSLWDIFFQAMLLGSHQKFKIDGWLYFVFSGRQLPGTYRPSLSTSPSPPCSLLLQSSSLESGERFAILFHIRNI